MNIGIIGANSFLARNLIYTLKKEFPTYRLALYGRGELQKDGFDNYKQINILDRETVQNIDLNCDIVFFFIGKTGSANGFDDYNTFIDVNEKSLLNLLDEYRRQKSNAKIVFPSTRLVYKGKRDLQNENDEKEFKTIYAVNKYACEQYLQQFHNVFGVRYCIFRICVPYGSLILNASSYGTVDFMLKRAKNGQNITLYGDGTPRRTVTYIEDLCNVLIAGAKNDHCDNNIYNIGGEDYSLREMALLIAKKYCVGIDYIPWPEEAKRIESGDTVFCSTKLDKIIGNMTRSKFTDWINNL